VWIRNAYFGELQTFDACLGHQPGNGQYHHHAQPICLRAQLGDNVEVVKKSRTGTVFREADTPTRPSPILGWAFDGNPIYGPYGYSDPADPLSGLRRMTSSFSLRDIDARTTLPDWALPFHEGVSQQLAENQYGPAINRFFPLGRYLEDYEYVEGSGDLDAYNGRFAVTPEYPEGVYAYYITLEESGLPAFPYILGAQYYGEVQGGRAQTIPADAQSYVLNGVTTGFSADPMVNSWYTAGAGGNAQVAVGYAPDAGPAETWPSNAPDGLRTNGGSQSPVAADVQTVSFDEGAVYVDSEGLGSYEQHGPWFDPLFPGGVFGNYPSASGNQFRVSAATGAAAQKTTHGLGAVGVWVNGVAVFNMLDGASYSQSGGDDSDGGRVRPTAIQSSAASYEQGPMAPGSLVSAFALFGARLAISTAAAESAEWPTELAGAVVTVSDSAGATHQAQISYASPGQVNYRMPEGVADGVAEVTIAAGGEEVSAGIYLVEVYPNLFQLTADGLVAGNVLRVSGDEQSYEDVFTSVDGVVEARTIEFSGDELYLVFYGTGIGVGSPAVSVTVNGQQVDVLYGGPQGTYDGLDQFNIRLPASLAGAGEVQIVVTADGRASNPVYVRL